PTAGRRSSAEFDCTKNHVHFDSGEIQSRRPQSKYQASVLLFRGRDCAGLLFGRIDAKGLLDEEITISVALSDQHSRLADGPVEKSRPEGDTRRHTGLRPGSSGLDG